MPVESRCRGVRVHSLLTLAPERCVPSGVRFERECVARLVELNAEYARARAALDECVREARDAGLSWNAIAGAVGLTRQGARQRWM